MGLLQHPLYIVLVFPWLVFDDSVDVLNTVGLIFSTPADGLLHRHDVLDESWKETDPFVKIFDVELN